MPISASPQLAAAPSRSNIRSAVLGAGAILAVAANAVVATGGVAAGASPSFGPLSVPAYATFTLIAFALAHIGWRVVRARASNPERLLRVLVPVATVLSFIPDGVLLATGFIPGSSPTAVAALAIMHLVVVAVVVPVSRVVAPLAARGSRMRNAVAPSPVA